MYEKTLSHSCGNLFQKKNMWEIFFQKNLSGNFSEISGISGNCPSGKFLGKFSEKMWETFSSDVP